MTCDQHVNLEKKLEQRKETQPSSRKVMMMMMMMMILLTMSNKRSHKTYTSGDKETKRMMIHELKFRTLTSPIVRETMI